MRAVPGAPLREATAASRAPARPARLHRRTEDAPISERSARWAETVHWVTLAAAFAFWAWVDRNLWFFGDEWDFLVRRGLSYPPTSSRSIWFPHNEHWSTLPVLLWRGLYHFVHLSSYWPYLVPVLLAQVAVMHLAWRICKHNAVDPWVATAAVALLGFLGAGAEDLASAFQVSFVGSVLFGFVAFDLLDRPEHRAGVDETSRRLGLVRPAGQPDVLDDRRRHGHRGRRPALRSPPSQTSTGGPRPAGRVAT